MAVDVMEMGSTDSQFPVKDEKTKDKRVSRGLNVWQTSFFIMGEVAGSGVLALPNAVLGTGWIGIVLVIVFCGMALYTGIRLGTSWNILEERYEEYRHEETRQPYQAIGLKSFGSWMRYVVAVCIDITSLGDCVVYLLLIAGMLEDLLQLISVEISICYWSLIVTAIMIPLSWLGTPKDFWPLAAVAAITVFVACILITIQCLLDIGVYGAVYFTNPTFKSFSLSFGAILFAYGGATAFPTFQNDMKNRKKFTGAASLGFLVIISVYLLVTCAGFFIYGYHVNPNITLTMSDGPLKITAQVLLIIHLCCAFVVVINPCFQDFDEYLKVPHGFSLKRCIYRTVVILFILFIGETVPSFSKIQNLIGGSTTTLLTFIFPTIFYTKLCSMKGNWKKRDIPLHELAFIIEIMVIGLLGAIASTVSAIWDIASPNALSLPCYVSQ